MLLAHLILPLLAAAQASDPPIMVVGRAWAPFISPMGEPFRPSPDGDDTLARWFYQADRDRDATLTPIEMQADADRFFATLDRNQDDRIDPDELVFYEWEIAPEIQVNSRWRRARGELALQGGDKQSMAAEPPLRSYDMVGLDDCLQGAARYSLLNMPQPVAAADADFNRVISRAEFRQAALARFQLLDRGSTGRLALQALHGFVPPLKAGCRLKTNEGAGDKRIGLPLPPRD